MNFIIAFPTGYKVDDVYNGNIDINVIVNDEEVYFGTIFTISNIQELMVKDESDYFWATDMVIVNNLSRKCIWNAVKEIVEENYITQIFSKIGNSHQIFPEGINNKNLMTSDD